MDPWQIWWLPKAIFFVRIGGWQLTYFLNVSPRKLGKMKTILTTIFSQWVEITSQFLFLWFLLRGVRMCSVESGIERMQVWDGMMYRRMHCSWSLNLTLVGIGGGTGAGAQVFFPENCSNFLAVSRTTKHCQDICVHQSLNAWITSMSWQISYSKRCTKMLCLMLLLISHLFIFGACAAWI